MDDPSNGTSGNRSPGMQRKSSACLARRNTAMGAVAVLLAWVLIAGVQEVRGDPPVEFVRNLERGVSTAEFEALVRISSQPQQWPRQSYRGDSIPKAYLPFRPIRVETGLGRDYVYLYERDTAHAYLVIATTPKNQTIHVIENLRGRETRRMVWVKDPAAYRRLNPAGRLISIIGWPLRGGTEWIVTPGRLLQIQRPGRGATDDELEREVPLTPREMDRFTQTIEALRKARKGSPIEQPMWSMGCCSVSAIPRTVRSRMMTSSSKTSGILISRRYSHSCWNTPRTRGLTAPELACRSPK